VLYPSYKSDLLRLGRTLNPDKQKTKLHTTNITNNQSTVQRLRPDGQ